MKDPTQRFSNRVANYVRFRPGYPAALLATLAERCGLTPAWVIADIGSGTGILTRLFLEHGNPVFGVEPNRKMRLAAEKLLKGYPNFTSLATQAEYTGLPTASIDLITAGQSFHWFDPSKARPEFERILRPGGWVALVWNERSITASPFMAGYEQLLAEYGIDYNETVHRVFDLDAIRTFFGAAGVTTAVFSNHQVFDFAGLQGRLLSSSYIPQLDDPRAGPMLRALEHLFQEHQSEGQVVFQYETRLYYGEIV